MYNTDLLLLSKEEILSRKRVYERIPHIYFLIKNDEIVYVGQCVNGNSRIYTHARDKDFDSFAYIECVDYDPNLLEAMYIVKYNPKYNNKRIPKNDKYKGVDSLSRFLGIKRVDLLEYIRNRNIIGVLDNTAFYVSDFTELTNQIETK
jgi:hypothetical protein